MPSTEIVISVAVIAMPAKVEVEVATVSREVGNGTQRLVRESEACLGRG